MTAKVTYVYPKVLTFTEVYGVVQRKLDKLGLGDNDEYRRLALGGVAAVAAPIAQYPKAPFTKAKIKPNTGPIVQAESGGDRIFFFNPYFFEHTGEMKPLKDAKSQPDMPLSTIAQAVQNRLSPPAYPNLWQIAVPPNIGRLIEEGFQRGYLPYFSDNGFALFAFPPGAKPVIQTSSLPVLYISHIFGGALGHPLTGDFRFWDAAVKRGSVDGMPISHVVLHTYDHIASHYAVVGLDGVKYKAPNQTLAATLEAERVKRGGQAARAKARKELLSGDQAEDDAEAIGLTEQGYRNLLTVAYPYMIPRNIYGNKDITFDPENPPPEYAQAVTGALAFLARQDPTIVTGRGLVSDLCRSIVDTMYRRTTHFQHQGEEERRQKIKAMVKEDQEARRKLALWEANGWDHAGLKEEDKFFLYEASNISFDPDYALFAPYVSAVNVMHLGKDEAEKAYKETDEKRSNLIIDLHKKYDNMPEIKEREARRLREEQERKERNERRPLARKEAGERMLAWLEKQPVVDVAKTLKSDKNHVFYAGGGLFYPAEATTRKKGVWPLLNIVPGYGALSRNNTQAQAVTFDEFVEAYRQFTKDIPDAAPVPEKDREAWFKVDEWRRRYDDRTPSYIEEMIGKIQSWQKIPEVPF